ncbi:MAG: DUF4147 domain-containing protein, partial [Acidobacteriota bacterium]|nr:DUF4147 domain-containing protein [Acidobacteriota bacterium]
MSARAPDPTLELRRRALEVAQSWRAALDLDALIAPHVADLTGAVDLVAIGKAAPEMCGAASRLLGQRVRRRFVVSDVPAESDPGVLALIGEHPVPGRHSEEAGYRLFEFLERTDGADTTVFLVSGGASSVCVAPAPPITLEDLAAVFREALALGWDVTRLNHLRAATSLIGGGAVLRRVRSARSRSLIMVDNALEGAPWVASA